MLYGDHLLQWLFPPFPNLRWLTLILKSTCTLKVYHAERRGLFTLYIPREHAICSHTQREPKPFFLSLHDLLFRVDLHVLMVILWIWKQSHLEKHQTSVIEIWLGRSASCWNTNTRIAVNLTSSFVDGGDVLFRRFRQFHSNCLQTTGFGREDHPALSQHPPLSLVKIPEVTKWKARCVSLQVVISGCPSIGGLLCQCDTGKITASPANSSLSASIKCHPCIFQVHIYVHIYLIHLSNRQRCFSPNVCLVVTHPHVFSFIYSHIDASRGADTVLYTVVRISLQNINGHCGGAFEMSHSTLLAADPHIHSFPSVPITLLFLFINGSASFMLHIPLAGAGDVQMTRDEMQGVAGEL